ncbi:MAG: hypothetical protein M1833_005201 [Piccolia ochrophora]|nr:MAG: hypothetical protein M1833_005201 [Piccolia ochrophora]
MSGKSRLPLILGVTVAGAGGYYLYSAGGDPKVAQKQIEHDAARASSTVKSEIPGREKEARKQGEEYAQKAGAKFDSAVDDARSKLSKAEADAKSKWNQTQSEADKYRQQTGNTLQKKIDEADKKVEEGASKAKSGVSSWFGGK